MNKISISSTKGSSQGSLLHVAGWLSRMQPSGATLNGEIPSHIEPPKGCTCRLGWATAILLASDLDERIQTLLEESQRAGDRELTLTCTLALEGSETAREMCAQTLAEAEIIAAEGN